MKPQNAISSELLALAPFLATVKRDNTFGVPQGYFAQLEQNTLSKVLEANELNAQAPVTMLLRQKQDMTVPKDYFEELYHTVMAINTAEKTAATLETIPPAAQTPFTTPNGYFDQLHQTILQQVTDLAQDEQADEALILAAANEGLTTPAGFFAEMQTNIWERITNLANEEANLNTHTIDQAAANDGFTTPEGYFAESAEAVLYAVTDQEYLPDTLQQLKTAPAFGTPQGYFDQLPQTILQKTAQQPQSAKEISLPAQQPALRYALRVAAVVAMLFVGWQLLNRSADTGNNGELALLTPNPALLAKMETAMIEAGITQKDLQYYISNNADEFANFDLEELNITASDLSIKNTTSKSIQLTPEAMDMLDISADDIDQFLSE
ncbi:MAG TPA: hypothetical protein PK239_14470 [Chitinophagales bacterium]|nr:hypothetical protein [Chitinophagales bacterium]HRK28477.1 hypothetical protein [Chitinophagales bacterium]